MQKTIRKVSISSFRWEIVEASGLSTIPAFDLRDQGNYGQRIKPSEYAVAVVVLTIQLQNLVHTVYMCKRSTQASSCTGNNCHSD
jgi:hypothetical protein